MGLFTTGQVVVVPFPYSDLSGQKVRPTLLLANAGHDDWIICQITSNPFSDPSAIPLTASSFVSGGLRHTSYLRPSKLFTANESVIVGQAGMLTEEMMHEVREALITVIRKS